MDEKFEEMIVREFEYVLREQRTFLQRLLKLGVSEEVESEITEKLQIIAETLGEK